jgi:chemotaxis protein histidine kinase CheA
VSFFSDERSAELKELFFESATELLQALNEEGLVLERNPGDPEVVRGVRRTVHTLKGDSAACGFQELSSLAHALEDALTPDSMSRHAARIAELVLQAADAFEGMLNAYRSGAQPPSGVELEQAIRKVLAAPADMQTATPKSAPAQPFAWSEYAQLVIADALKRGLKVLELSLTIDPRCLAPAAAVQMVRNAMQDVGTILVQSPDAPSDDMARLDLAVATSYDEEHVALKCRIPAITSDVLVRRAAADAPVQDDPSLTVAPAKPGPEASAPASLSPEDAQKNLVDLIESWFEPEAWSLLLVDAEKNELHFDIATGPAGEKLKKLRIKMGDGIAGWVAQNCDAVISPDVYSDPRFAKNIDEMVKFKTRNMICLPMRGKYRVIGVVQLINCSLAKFDLERLDMLQTLSDYAAQGIEHSRLTETAAAATVSAVVSAVQDNVLRVDAERIDTVLNLVGELVIGKSMLMQTMSEFDRRFSKDPIRTRLADALAFQARVLSDLQKSVMKIRMVPVEQLFRRFPRLVRDVAKTCEKDVGLVVTGQDTDLDKSVLDALAEPLSHLVRNAIGHGIEALPERAAAAKPAQGTVKLNAYHQGNEVVIEVSDDGAGIDRDKVATKAIERGLSTAEEVSRLTDGEVYAFIFQPGFSTADEVTSVSGRGVGMDVVKSVLDRLKGTITIDSRPGQGTRFLLKVPLTLAIIKALMFGVGEKLYAVPLGSVVEITRAHPSEVHVMDRREVLRLRDEVLPLVRLDSLAGGAIGQRKKLFVVVLSLGDRKAGLVVDRLVGEEELVIKALDDHLVATDLVSGASILGDGTVVLILNVHSVATRLGRLQIMEATA